MPPFDRLIDLLRTVKGRRDERRQSVADLVAALSDEDRAVRREAASALTRRGDPEAIPYLLRRLAPDDDAHPEETSRLAAEVLFALEWRPSTDDERAAVAVATGAYNVARALGTTGESLLVRTFRAGRGDTGALVPLMDTLDAVDAVPRLWEIARDERHYGGNGPASVALRNLIRRRRDDVEFGLLYAIAETPDTYGVERELLCARTVNEQGEVSCANCAISDPECVSREKRVLLVDNARLRAFGREMLAGRGVPLASPDERNAAPIRERRRWT